jgi:hypothetical protein
MARPKDDVAESQRKKFEHHKEANSTLSYYLDQGNLLGAYVIAYSLLEDRLRAMYVVVQRDIHKVVYTEAEVNGSLARIINYLKENNHLTKELANSLQKSNLSRNNLLHNAMWELNVVSKDHITRVRKLRNEVSSQLEKIKRAVKKKG